MLVFFSDIHLTDGTSGETINPGAFDIFADHVAELARKRRAREVRIVLLGDGLDVIRSVRWLKSPTGTRPWDEPGELQETLTLDVLRATLDENREALEFLAELPGRVAERTKGRVPAERVRLDYVLGNHDWIINRYRSARALVAQRLNLPRPRYVEEGFPVAFRSPPEAYNVVARHGDLYDRLNYDAQSGRDASSLGDAIVIELLNRLPVEVENELGSSPEYEPVLASLREIDNLRPLTLAPAWVVETASRLGADQPDVAKAIRRALRRCIDEFRQTPMYTEFGKRQLTWLQRALLDDALNQVKRSRIAWLDRWTTYAMPLLQGGKPWARQVPWLATYARGQPEYALGERHSGGTPPRYVIYGHTHRPGSAPLGPESGRFTMNSGTWRTVWERAETGDEARHFDSWKVMSYIAVYSDGETRGKHQFEVWTGNLRDRMR